MPLARVVGNTWKKNKDREKKVHRSRGGAVEDGTRGVRKREKNLRVGTGQIPNSSGREIGDYGNRESGRQREKRRKSST